MSDNEPVLSFRPLESSNKSQDAMTTHITPRPISKHRPTLLRKLIWTLRSIRIGKAERKKSEMIDITRSDKYKPAGPRRMTHLLEK